MILEFLFSFVYLSLLIYFRRQISTAFLAQSFVYFLSSILVVKSGNLFHALIVLEFLSIAGVFMVAYKGDVKSAVQYGAVNFLSGAMILAAISNQDLEIFAVWPNPINRLILLAGIALHCGLLPVSATFVNAYSKCSNLNAVFLQAFSTKVALIILYKKFSGEELLSYLAIPTIIYAIIYSLKERDIFKLIAYNAIGQIGLISLAIAHGGNILPYIMPSVLCQTLLYIIAFEMQNWGRVNLILLLIVVLSMSSFPLTFSFGTKSLMLHAIENFYMQTFFVLSSFLLVLTTPLKLFYASKKAGAQELGAVKKIILIIFCGSLMLPVGFESYSVGSVLIQILLFFITVVFSLALKNKHFKPIKYDVDYMYNDFLIYIFSLVRKFLSSVKSTLLNSVKFEKSLFLKYNSILQEEAIEYTSFIAIGIVGLFLMISFFI